MGRKMTMNVCIVIVAMTLVVATFFTLLAFGLSERFTQSIKTATFKQMLDMEMPIVRYTYDSGSAEYSVSEGIKHLFYETTGVNTSDPIAMLIRANSLHRYFFNEIWEKRNQNGLPAPTPTPSGTVTPAPTTSTPDTGNTTELPDTTPTPTTTPAPSQTGSSTPKVVKLSEGRYSYGPVSIRNNSNLEIDFDRIMGQSFASKFESAEEGAQILIYHTHTTECYIKNLSELDDGNGDSWSNDNSRTVVRVGHELDTILSETYNFNVIHNATVHNYNYNESYNNSSITVRSVLKGNPTIKLSIDIHRDGLAAGQGKLRVVQEVNGENCAGLMFVVGTNETTSNPNWEDNLRLALELARQLEEIAPGIIRYVSIRSSRYNQHIAENGLLVEFGGDGNTVEEVTNSAKYLAQAIDMVMG